MIAIILYAIGICGFILGMVVLATLPIGAALHPETLIFVTFGKNLLIGSGIVFTAGCLIEAFGGKKK